MADFSRLKAIALEIKEAVEIGENTAEKVGGLLSDMVDALLDCDTAGSLINEKASKSELAEVLLRAQGRSDNYNGATDLVKYKSFGGEDYPHTEQRSDLIIYDINMWLDDQHCGSFATAEKMKSVPQGLMHIDQDGSCLWFINSPLSYATDTWLQIAFNGVVSETTINGVTRQYIHVSEAQDSQMWRRMCRQGVWGEWGQVSVSPMELAAITAALDTKANITDVNNALGTKANITDVNNALGTKADITALVNSFNEMLLRLQGKSSNYNNDSDPVLRKDFDSIEKLNAYLDSLQGTAPDNIPHGIIYVSLNGARLWVFNTPEYYDQNRWSQTVVNATLQSNGKIINGDSILQRTCHQGMWQPWRRLVDDTEIISTAVTQSLTDAQRTLARTNISAVESVNVAEFTSKGKRMRKGALYHYNGIPLHSRAILVNDGDMGGTEGDETNCLIFCYHEPNSGNSYGSQYFVFGINASDYSWIYTWTDQTVPPYILQAFSEYTESRDLTKVLIFDNPSNGEYSKEKVIYDRVVQRIGEIEGQTVPVVYWDYSDGFEIFGIDGGWLSGCAHYGTGNNKVVLDLYGTGADGTRGFVNITITKNGNDYTSSIYVKDLDATANTAVSGLMSNIDKQRLNTIYNYGKNKGWWN